MVGGLTDTLLAMVCKIPLNSTGLCLQNPTEFNRTESFWVSSKKSHNMLRQKSIKYILYKILNCIKSHAQRVEDLLNFKKEVDLHTFSSRLFNSKSVSMKQTTLWEGMKRRESTEKMDIIGAWVQCSPSYLW